MDRRPALTPRAIYSTKEKDEKKEKRLSVGESNNRINTASVDSRKYEKEPERFCTDSPVRCLNPEISPFDKKEQRCKIPIKTFQYKQEDIDD